MKKIALCLYGKFNNRLSNSSGIDGFEYIKQNILNGREVDVFIYSTDLENENIIRSLYSMYSKAIIFQQPKDFNYEIESNKIDESKFVPIEKFRTLTNTLSFLYSRKMSIQLLFDYCSKIDYSYDIVITCRFDLGQIDRYNGPRLYKVSEIYFNENFDMKFLYSAMWDQFNCGYADQWFYSSPENIQVLSLMYEKTLQYFQAESKYLSDIQSGLIDSSCEDEFSNEVFKSPENKSKKLKKYSVESAINNHLLHKYYFVESGLYPMSRFVANISNVANVLYTHTDYSDIWPMFFGQFEKYFNTFSKNYVFVNQYSDKIPKYYNQIIYDESKLYTDRLLHCLEYVNEEIIFFNHEDMILYDYPDFSIILGYLEAMKTSPNFLTKKYDFIRLIKGGNFISYKSLFTQGLNNLLLISKWIFSIQPSFWQRKKFLKLLSKHKSQGIWEFENDAQSTCRKMFIKGGFSNGIGKKRGHHHWDNKIYPYIATAIVKGKWNTLEYSDILESLFLEYNIDKSVRGTNDTII